MNLEFLELQLASNGVPFKGWGENGTKTIDHLLKEIQRGEAVIISESGWVIRIISTAAINVFYAQEEKTFVLVEEKQLFRDGRKRIRTLTSSLGEKIRALETPEEAARRGLKEELSIAERIPLIGSGKEVRQLNPSKSYPGIYTANILHRFDIFLPEKFYRAEGYVEMQKDKTSYFVWKLKTT